MQMQPTDRSSPSALILPGPKDIIRWRKPSSRAMIWLSGVLLGSAVSNDVAQAAGLTSVSTLIAFLLPDFVKMLDMARHRE